VPTCIIDSPSEVAAMASIDANMFSPTTRRQDPRPARRCENCNREMNQLAAFPAIAGREAVMIFRCYGCNCVVSEGSPNHLASQAI
jgi:hypothetical protein